VPKVLEGVCDAVEVVLGDTVRLAELVTVRVVVGELETVVVYDGVREAELIDKGVASPEAALVADLDWETVLVSVTERKLFVAVEV
jgi:hypothetical protein